MRFDPDLNSQHETPRSEMSMSPPPAGVPAAERRSAHSIDSREDRGHSGAAAWHGVGRMADWLIGLLVFFALLASPWAFGTTTPWAISGLIVIGIALWIILAIKRVARWGVERSFWRASSDADRVLAGLTLFFLAYCLTSALNARASNDAQDWNLVYRKVIWWLPHSYNAASTWHTFWLYLAFGGLFWGVKNWMVRPWRSPESNRKEGTEDLLLPKRMRTLIWALSINGALVSLQGILQRVMGSTKLLWLVTPTVNKDPMTFFGPFAYHANAAQYFNLLWPLTLGAWWTYQRVQRQRVDHFHGNRSNQHLLLSCCALCAIAPWVTTSRGGAIIAAGLSVVAAVLFATRKWGANPWAKRLVLGFITLGVAGGILLGWSELAPRMENIIQGFQQRENIYLTGSRMVDDAPIYGTGPGTWASMFGLYRRSVNEYWPAQLHNDWMQFRIELGLPGLGMLLLGLVIVASRGLFPGHYRTDGVFLIMALSALGGCLIHARFDFPFQVPGVVMLFLTVAAIASCLSARSSHGHGRSRAMARWGH